MIEKIKIIKSLNVKYTDSTGVKVGNETAVLGKPNFSILNYFLV